MNRRPYWLWPYRASARVAAGVDRFADRCGVLVGRGWPVWAVVAGALPVLLASVVGGGWHGSATGLMLVPAVLACVRSDRCVRAVVILAVAVAVHSAVVIGLTVANPTGTAALIPGGEAYWQKTWHWIVTGDDVLEYRPADWLPDHLLLLFGVPALGYTSLGAVPLAAGVTQLDLMNYYVGRLILVGDSPAAMVLLGWHPWSVLRGLGYGVLIVEVASLSFERLVGRPVSTRRRRAVRWLVGVALVLGDAGVKLCCSDWIRAQLFARVV